MEPRSYFSEYAKLQKLIPVYQEYKKVAAALRDAELLKSDSELGELAELELKTLSKVSMELENQLNRLLAIEDPLLTKNAIIEIQAGVGGDESSLFVEMLFGMYAKYAKKMGWEVEITDVSHGNQGGFKYIALVIEGAYGAFRFESGSHKIQRVSPTDPAKRMHTSAATVISMPELEVEEISINKNDVRVDTFCSGGPGGQHQNKTESGVRLTHLPTNTVVSLRDGKHQRQNYERAWKLLASRVAENHRVKQEAELSKQKKELRGDGSRGGCIRTYNFPQDRITDHRTKHTVHNIEKVLAGNLDPLLEGIQDAGK